MGGNNLFNNIRMTQSSSISSVSNMETELVNFLDSKFIKDLIPPRITITLRVVFEFFLASKNFILFPYKPPVKNFILEIKYLLNIIFFTYNAQNSISF